MRRAQWQKVISLSCLLGLFVGVCCLVFIAIPEEDANKSWRNMYSKFNSVKTHLVIPDLDLGTSLYVQYISECQCYRKWMYPPSEDEQAVKNGSHQFKRLNSSCSDEGTHYQTAQNVISFSLFYPDHFPKLIPGSPQTSPLNYQIGLLQNLQMIRKFYPGYSLRVYTSLTLRPREYYCELLCQNKDIFWCDIRKVPEYGDLSRMNFIAWRFLPLGDATVNIFHSRDLDSLITRREVAVVKDWLFNTPNGRKAILLMRDRKIGHNIPMLGGLWGADNELLDKDKAKKMQKKIIAQSQLESFQGKGRDQRVLENVIFHPMAKHIVAYDSYNCVKWSKFTEVRPFPVKCKDPATDFVGNRVNFTGDGKNWVYKVFECPLECRPSYGRDWIYC